MAKPGWISTTTTARGRNRRPVFASISRRRARPGCRSSCTRGLRTRTPAASFAEEAGKGAFPGVIHCFSAGRAVAETALEIGLYVSFSGILTFKNAEEVRAVARDVPVDRLLVETDAPYLAPVPHRGRRNEPAHVVHTAARLAELKGLDDAAIAQMTTDNFFTVIL